MKKKIIINAYTKFNLGDDLFIKVLCERYPNTSFILYAPTGYKILFNKIKNVSIFPSNLLAVRGFNFIFRILKTRISFRRTIAHFCDAGVYIGGSLFIQGEKWKTGLRNLKDLKIDSKPFFLLGANFGPYKNNEFYLEHREIFKSYTDICFRENNSYQLFSDLNNVRIADDIIFQLKNDQKVESKESIVISVIEPSRKILDNNFNDNIYFQKIRDISIYFIDRGYTVTLMSFCEYEGDKDAIDEIFKLIPFTHTNRVNKYLYKNDIEEALNVIKSSSFVVASRFHAMILGWVFNKPVFPIVYSEKMTNVMRDIGFTGEFTDLNEILNLNPELVFDSFNSNLLNVSNHNAEKHFEELDKFLAD